jgi:hypothetical protein
MLLLPFGLIPGLIAIFLGLFVPPFNVTPVNVIMVTVGLL